MFQRPEEFLIDSTQNTIHKNNLSNGLRIEIEISLYEYDKNYNFSRLAERNYNFYHTSREIFLSQQVDYFDKFFII